MANWQVPLITQKTVKLCWEACARMMWQWHYKNLNGYASKAGNYSKLDKGLNEEEMDLFYKQIGPEVIAVSEKRECDLGAQMVPGDFNRC